MVKGKLITGGTGAKVRPVVPCKGTVCTYGLIDTQEVATEIHKRFFEGYAEVVLPHKFKIAIGGCPNNCIKPDLNDLGIIGQKEPNYNSDVCRGCNKCSIVETCLMKAARMENNKLVIDKSICNNCGLCISKCSFNAIPNGNQGYKIYIGGRWGKKIRMGSPISKLFTKEEALNIIEKAILLYKYKGISGERFGETVERLGEKNIEKMLLLDNLLINKETILKVNTLGGATC